MRRATLVLLLSLSACGQSGDLYLPPEEPPAPPVDETPAPMPAQGPAEEEEESKDAH